MDKITFQQLLEELDGNSVQTLANKNSNYAQGDDPLHNFNAGADIMGTTPAMCCWGYMTKHLVALRDKVEKGDFSDREDFLEKCQDTINYIRFLWCIGNEHESYNLFDHSYIPIPDCVKEEIMKNEVFVRFEGDLGLSITSYNRDKIYDLYEAMCDIAHEYGLLSKADVLDLVGLTPTYKDNQVGWILDTICETSIVKQEKGYMIKLPRLLQIK